MSNINLIIQEYYYPYPPPNEEEDKKKKLLKLGLGVGGALLGAGALASQTHTGKAAINYLKMKHSSNPIDKIGHGMGALYHGLNSPFRNTILKKMAKGAAVAAGGTALAYGGKKFNDWRKSDAGKEKIDELKSKATDKFHQLTGGFFK